MRTTLNIEDALVEKASKLTGINEKTALVRKGLEALISIESSKRLAALGGARKKSGCRDDEDRGRKMILADTNVLDQTFQRI